MSLASRIAGVLPHLRHAATDRAVGLRSTKTGEAVRVHHGWYVSAETWGRLSREDQHLALILAVSHCAKVPPIFSHVSAAVLLGLPVVSALPAPVHITTGARGAGNRSQNVVRHPTPIDDDDLVQIEGLTCTSPDRTIFDLCRTARPQTALSCADGHLRDSFRVHRSVDKSSLDEWRASMAARAGRARSVYGVRSVPRVLELADPRKDSPLESISHWRLHRLGYEVALQVPVPGPDGGTYYVDFELLGLDVFGECDGKFKYTGDALSKRRSAEEQVYAEKRRDDWVQGSSGKRVIHWGFTDVATPQRFADRLGAFRVPVPRPPHPLER